MWLFENVDIFIFLEFYIFFGIFELLENMCHTTRAVGQTLKGKKIIFGFLKVSVTRCGRPDRHNKAKENIFIFLDSFLFFCNFYNLKYFVMSIPLLLCFVSPAPSAILTIYRQIAVTDHSQCKKHDSYTSSFLALFFSFFYIHIFWKRKKNKNKKGKQNMIEIKIKKLRLKTKIK